MKRRLVFSRFFGIRGNLGNVQLFSQEKYGFPCFCCCNPAVLHRMMDHFMNETTDGILQFCKCYLLKMLLIQNHQTATIEKSKEQFYSRISTKLMDPAITRRHTGQY